MLGMLQSVDLSVSPSVILSVCLSRVSSIVSLKNDTDVAHYNFNARQPTSLTIDAIEL